MKKKIVIIIIALILLEGYQASKELNDLSIVSGIAIDKSKSGKYEVTAQILNPKTQGGNSQKSGGNGEDSKFVEYKEEAETIQLALRSMVNESPKKLYLGHMQLLVVSEEIAKYDLRECFDFFLRDNEVNKEFMLIVARNCKASDITSVSSSIESDPVKNIISSIESTATFEGKTSEDYITQKLGIMLERGIELTLSSVVIDSYEKEDSEKSSREEQGKKEIVKISDLAYFSKGKFKGYLSSDDSVSYNMLRNNVKRTIIQTKTEELDIATEIYELKCNLKPRKKEDEFIVDIDIKAKGLITESNKSVNLANSKIIKKYEKEIEKNIKNNILGYVDRCQHKYKSDIVGYEALFYKYANKEYRKVSKNFNENIFPNIKTNVKVDVKLEREGELIKDEK